MAFSFIKQGLQQRKQQALLRSRSTIDQMEGARIAIDGKSYLNFSSNDYLGLAQDPRLIEANQLALAKYGCGSGASPLVTGYQKPHAQLEQDLSDWLACESALLFSTGFSANQAVIKALLSKGDLLLQDKLNHASLMEAGMLSPAKMKRFKHNDLASLEKLLAQEVENALVVTEGVFSMDGDQAPLRQIVEAVSGKENAWLMIDDAHGVGTLGEQGRGSLAQEGLTSTASQIQTITFGKALGVSGAALLVSKELRDYLVNYSRAYVYSTAMPAAQAAAVSKAVEIVRTEPEHQQKLQDNIHYFKQCCAQALEGSMLQLMPSDTAIQPLLVGGSEPCIKLSESLKQAGFWVTAIRPPTVPPNGARIRITLSTTHEREDIDALVEQFKQLGGM